MKAYIKNGKLFVDPENGTEEYALDAFMAENGQFIDAGENIIGTSVIINTEIQIGR